MKEKLLLLLVVLLSLCNTSCKDEEFTTDTSKRLSYSADTVSFDTILSTFVSPAKQFLIYNNTGENIRVESICKLGSSEAFQLNINGQSATTVSNVELMSGDSLFIFVQCVGNESDGELVLLDSIAVCYNGNTDKIILSAVSNTPIVFNKKQITSDTLLQNNGRPYLIFGTLTVAEGAVLTIDEGVDLFFYNGAKMQIDGGLVLNGAIDKKIRMRYFRQDEMNKDLPYYKVAGSWKGITVSQTCKELAIFYADIEGGDYGVLIDSTANVEPFFIGNTIIQNNKYGSLVSEDAFIYSFNSVFANGGLYNVRLIGGKYLFNHCTIASYFNNSSVTRNAAMFLTDREDDEHIIPLRVEVNNSVIYGASKEELKCEKTTLAQLPTETLELGIYYSLVAGTPREDDKYFVKNRWNANPKYEIDRGTYFADFHLDTLSSARTIGDPMICRANEECQYDIEGKSRVDDFLPDAGAYEY